MKFEKLAFLLLVQIASLPLDAADYSEAQKCQIYFRTAMPRPDADMLSVSDSRWTALNGPLLVDKVNRIGVNKDRATVLAASAIEFNFLLQPTSDIKTLEERRLLLESLQEAFLELNPLMLELAKMEHVFTHLLDLEQANPTDQSSSQLFFQGGLVAAATIMSVPYIAKHLSFDVQLLSASQENPLWLGLMVCLKLVSTAGGFYKSYEMVKCNAQQIQTKVRKDDRFVLDFSKAMVFAEKITKIITENPTLANKLTIFIDFDHTRKLSPGLNDTLLRAKNRLTNNRYFFPSLWKTKDSPSLCENIKKYTDLFKTLYYGLARLDAYLAVIRIYRDFEAREIPATFAQFRLDKTKPCFKFTDLRNPLIDNSVANDFEIDGSVVLNGPSTCGKTAAMKSISSVIIMAQSILLVPAREALLTPVSNIGAHFNVKDNINEGQSSYEAQRLAIKSLLDLAKKPGITALFIDEPYNCITSDLGEAMTDELITTLKSLSHTVFFVSTHHRKPTEHGEQKDGMVYNWQPEVLEDDDKFVRTFKIKPGIATWWYDNKQKAMAFIRQLDEE